MVAPLSKSKRDAIKVRLKEGKQHFEIAEEMRVSIQTVKNYSATLNMFGDIMLPSVGKRGRKSNLRSEMIEVRGCVV